MSYVNILNYRQEVIWPYFTSFGFGSIKSPKSTFYVDYITNGKQQYRILTELHVYNNINEANNAYSAWIDNFKAFKAFFPGQDTNVGDFGWIDRGDSIVFVKNNVLSYIRMWSITNVDETANIENVYKLSKKQEEKISRILDMIK